VRAEPARVLPAGAHNDVAARIDDGRIDDGRDALRGNMGAVCKADFPFDHRDAIEALALALVRQLEMAKAFRGQIESTMKPP
jgi:hypothetical protein